MNQISLGGKINVPQIGLGCMRIDALDAKTLDALVKGALELGINFFDHADIYVGSKCESLFGDVIGANPGLRDSMILQTKCAIKPGVSYDFSKDYILWSVDESLKRLKTDYIDVYLLHRPDILMEPDEVAEAFAILEKAGKVKFFGVSNENPGQIELLNKYCGGKIIANQLQLSIAHCPIFDQQINVNTMYETASDRTGDILNYCRLNNITIQAWSPFQYGFFEGVFLGSDKYPELNKVVDGIAAKYGVANTAIAVAWISRHPANIQTIVGTTNLKRLGDIAVSCDVRLTREEWYAIYLSAGKILP